MGLSDRIELPEKYELPGFRGDPSKVEWKSKDVKGHPDRTVYRITEDGRLLEEQWHYDEVPEEERPMYDEDIGGFEDEWHQAFGMLDKITEGWEELADYHGDIRFYARRDDTRYEFKARFSYGELDEITRVE